MGNAILAWASHAVRLARGVVEEGLCPAHDESCEAHGRVVFVCADASTEAPLDDAVNVESRTDAVIIGWIIDVVRDIPPKPETGVARPPGLVAGAVLSRKPGSNAARTVPNCNHGLGNAFFILISIDFARHANTTEDGWTGSNSVHAHRNAGQAEDFVRAGDAEHRYS